MTEQGPLAGLQDQVASVLNGNGNGNYVYFPMQDQVGQPIVAVPSPRVALAEFFAIFRRR